MKKQKSFSKERQEINNIMNDWLEEYDKTYLVEVVWEDARTLTGSSDYQEIIKNRLLQARTIGYLINEDDDSIAIYGFLFPDMKHSLNDPEQYTVFRETHIIPKGWIKIVKVLNVDWEETKKFRERHKDWFKELKKQIEEKQGE